MPKAKRLPSGSWRARASYVGTDGKRHYESFTAPTKKEAEFMAAEFSLMRREMQDTANWSLGDAIDEYIRLKEPALSPTTINSYRKIRKHVVARI